MGYTYEEYMKEKCNSYNLSIGNLEDYDCIECKNRGYFMTYENGIEFFKECKCMEIRRSMDRLKASGLTDVMTRYTFDHYIPADAWQQNILCTAKEYLESKDRQWFYIGGQVGCGKTHICTAMVLQFLQQGTAARYLLWRDEIVRIKANVTEEEEYIKAVYPLKTVPVLYIDDFFKTEKGKYPTTADINIAFEILNYRYNNQNLITIISSEFFMDELMQIDEAVGSRILQRTKKFCINIPYDVEKNYRLREFNRRF